MVGVCLNCERNELLSLIIHKFHCKCSNVFAGNGKPYKEIKILLVALNNNSIDLFFIVENCF